jgi:hypothetical protein
LQNVTRTRQRARRLGALVVATAMLSWQTGWAQSDAAPPAKPSADAAPSSRPPPGPPPPGYAYPPPGYAYQPGYYYPVATYEPQPRWRPGQPAPDGYHVETKPDVKTIKRGVTMLVAFWLISVLAGAALNENEKPAPEDDNGVEPGDWSTLYIPIAGPFLTMKNTSTKQAGWPLLLIDGLLQSTGVIMIGVGFANRKEYLERNTAARFVPKLRLEPMVGPHSAGLSVTSSF